MSASRQHQSTSSSSTTSIINSKRSNLMHPDSGNYCPPSSTRTPSNRRPSATIPLSSRIQKHPQLGNNSSLQAAYIHASHPNSTPQQQHTASQIWHHHDSTHPTLCNSRSPSPLRSSNRSGASSPPPPPGWMSDHDRLWSAQLRAENKRKRVEAWREEVRAKQREKERRRGCFPAGFVGFGLATPVIDPRGGRPNGVLGPANGIMGCMTM